MARGAAIPVLVAFMLLTGVCNTLLTKYQDMQCVADCDTKRPKNFEQPVIQTLQMFVGESGCWLVVAVAALLRRYNKGSSGATNDDIRTLVDATNVVAKPFVDGEELEGGRVPLEGWKILMLALPAICDICGTTLMNVGLLFVAASIYQMTRGALVLFVGLFSVLFLKRHLSGWKWASLFIVVLGVAVVGLAGALEQKDGVPKPGDESKSSITNAMHVVRAAIATVEAHTAAETLLGVSMIAGAQIFTATQFVLEESIMERYSMDPINVVGWEGTFGFLVTLIGMGVLHAVVGRTDAGKGGYFDAREGFSEVFHNRAIALTSLAIMVSIGGFNFFGLSVTRSISATARSTIDTCRTLFIWLVSLGLGWESFKWLQVLGFALLVYGTVLYNEIVQPPTLAFIRRRTRREGISVGGNES